MTGMTRKHEVATHLETNEDIREILREVAKASGRVLIDRGQINLVKAAPLVFVPAAAWTGIVTANLARSVSSLHQCLKSLVDRNWFLHIFSFLIHLLILIPRKD